MEERLRIALDDAIVPVMPEGRHIAGFGLPAAAAPAHVPSGLRTGRLFISMPVAHGMPEGRLRFDLEFFIAKKTGIHVVPVLRTGRRDALLGGPVPVVMIPVIGVLAAGRSGRVNTRRTCRKAGGKNHKNE